MPSRVYSRGNRVKMEEMDFEPKSETQKLHDRLCKNGLPGNGQTMDADRLISLAAALAAAGRHLESGDEDEDDYWQPLIEEYQAYSAALLAYLRDAAALPLISVLRENHNLDPKELEVLLIVTASAIGATDSIRDIEDLQKHFPSFRRSRMETARMLLPESRLIMSGLIQLDEDRPFKQSSIAANPCFVEAVLRGKECFSSSWNCATQEELLKKLPLLRRMVNAAAEEIDDDSDDDSNYVRRKKRELNRFVNLFLREVQPEWKLAEIFARNMDIAEAIILVALLCDALLSESGNRRPWFSDGDSCSGENLAKAAADNQNEVNEIVRKCLSVSSRLAVEKLIAPIMTGSGDLHEDDGDALKNLSFQLTDLCLRRIGVKRKRSKSGGRKPLLRMEQLELSPEVHQSLELAVNQYTCRDVLESWELEKTIPYGRAVTMLFYGPPGVGKTAAAEAVAAMLKKRILVADYSQIQNCWVGQTEKNIVKLFNKAREDDCVLFWDEADAMFYDRETASQNWEVRDVNVLLQELEKFDGVCILSTNRKIELDKALARRISQKIEFKPPTREQALAIWKKLIPKKMPLADNIDFAELCSVELTGGEIKNVILNAARRAAVRGRKAKLEMMDFTWALAAEVNGKDIQGRSGRRLGF